MSFARPVISTLVALALLLALTGCVTTVEGPYQAKASKEKAASQYVQLGLTYFQQKEYELAIQRLERALEIDPESAEARSALGLVYQAQLETYHAEKLFKEALTLEPGYTRGRTYYAAFLYKEGRVDEALDQFLTASEDVKYPSRAQIFRNIGHIHTARKELKKAEQAYVKSFNIQPDQPEVLLAIASVKFRLNDTVSSQRFYNSFRARVRQGAIDHTPQSLVLGVKLARIQNNLDEEASLLLLLRSRFPNSPEYQRLLKESS